VRGFVEGGGGREGVKGAMVRTCSGLSSSIIDGRYTAQTWVMAGLDAARTCFTYWRGTQQISIATEPHTNLAQTH
jgi:hypothetical protein